MKKSTLFYSLYYLIMLCILVLEYFNLISIDLPIDRILLALCSLMLITRIPFLNSIFSNINSVERLAEEQREHVFMKWSIFIRIVIPLLFYVVLKVMW